MKITIIGATKGIGKEVMKQAIEQGNDVTVLARNQSKVNKPDVKVIQGDFLNENHVKQSVKEAEVVVISVGMLPTFKPVNLFSKGTRNLINAIKELQTNPLIIAVTGIGAGDSVGHGGFFYDKIMNPLLLKTIYQDKNKQEQILKNEYDNWIVVRPGFLTNGTLTQTYKSITDLKGVTAGKISRADVADFILKQAKSPEFLKQTPLLTY